MTNIKVKKNKDNPETPEVLAESLIRIADGFDYLLKTSLTTNAIIVLLRAMPGMSQISGRDINLVLTNLPRLKGYYVRKKN